MDLESVRCSCCGGIDITVSKNKKLGTCNHCGATVIMPRENEEVVALLNTAYLQRANYDFDAAIKTYEFALDKDSTEKSAYEGLLLAKYGIEYVKDPRTGRLVPTCHRTHFNSIYEDDAYLVLNELCDEEEKEVLAKKVAEIDKLQKAIVKQLEKEEDFDIFISYKATDEKGEKTEDSIIARNIYDKLTAQNYKVFFSEKTLEDRLGSDYEPIIFKAIHTAKMFILVGTKKDYVNSVWVKNEWTRFIDRIKTDDELSAQSFIPVFKEMSPYDMPKVNNKFVQGVDASKLGYDITVADGISKILKPKEEKDIIKTFNSFENVIEMKNAQKNSKKEYNAKKYNEFKKDKLKFVFYHVLQALCFAIPVVMLLLNFSRGFVFLNHANLWIWVALGVLWGIVIAATIIIRRKRLIGQSPAKITIAAVAYFIALIMCPIMFVSPLYGSIYLHTNNWYTGYDGYNDYCYYQKSREWGKSEINYMFIIKGNQGKNLFVVPEEIEGLPVNLSFLSLRNNIDEIVFKNLIKDEMASTQLQIAGPVPMNEREAHLNTTTINKVSILEALDTFSVSYVNINDLNFNFDATTAGVYGSSAYNEKIKINNIRINNKIGDFIVNGEIAAKILDINFEGDSFLLRSDIGTEIEKILLRKNIKKLNLSIGNNENSITDIEISGKTQEISIGNTQNIRKLNVTEQNDNITVNIGSSSKIDEVCVNNNVKNLHINRIMSNSGEKIETLKIGRNIEYLQIFDTYANYDFVGTICFEGSEAEWNLIEKDIPASVTVLFNQAI